MYTAEDVKGDPPIPKKKKRKKKGEIRLEPTQIPISLVDQKEKSDKNKGTKTSPNKTGSREGILDEPIKGPVSQKVNSVEIRPVNGADTNLYKVTQGEKEGILDEPKKVYVLQNVNSGGIKIVNCADTSVHIVLQGPKQLIESQEKERNKRNKMSI